MSPMMKREFERDRGGASPPLRKEEHMYNVTYASLEDMARLVRDMGEGDIIRVIFEEADDGEGHDS